MSRISDPRTHVVCQELIQPSLAPFEVPLGLAQRGKSHFDLLSGSERLESAATVCQFEIGKNFAQAQRYLDDAVMDEEVRSTISLFDETST